MKTFTFILLSTFFISTANSQTNITNYNWVTGVHRYFYTEATVNPNPIAPGNNVTWDFTTLTSDPDDSVTFQLSGSTPFTSEFSNANVVWSEYKKAENRTVLWHFYKDQFSFEFLGYGEVGVGTNVFSSQKKMLKFPFTFNTTFTDYYTSGSSYKSDVTYDGYGTLKLPNATYSNVYRTTSIDSSSPSNIVKYYEWFDNDRRILFMKINKSFMYTYYLKTTNSTSVNSVVNASSINIFPNPSNGEFNIKLPNELNTADIQIYDLTGQLLKQFNASSNTLNFTIDNPGYYIVKITNNNQTFYKKIAVIE